MGKTKIYLLFYLLFAIISLNWIGCKNSSSEPELPVDESATLLKYLEENGNYINTQAPSVISAEDVRNVQINNPAAQVIIDLRNPDDFTKGHIEGAVNIGFNSLYDYAHSVNANRIVLVCYGGQTSSYATGLLRLSGVNNIYSMKWGMSAWDTSFAKSAWLLHNGNSKKSYFTTTPMEKPAKDTILPVLQTGKRKPDEILNSRIKQLLGEGFIPARLTSSDLFKNFTDYFIVDYCPEEFYLNPGHIQNSINYKPQYDLHSTTNLKRLPLNKTIIFYCFTGQSSGYAVAYLRVLGYNAKFVIYGASTMIYDDLKARNIDLFSSSEIKYYPYTKGN